jgi:hypothetical protein
MSAERAIRLAMESSDSMFARVFPKSAGSQSCEIYRGGPYPGKLLPGACRTEVDATRSDRSDYLVSFTQVWDAHDFAAGNDPSSGDLHYTWSFLVTSAGTVIAQPPSGNFPPQYVR